MCLIFDGFKSMSEAERVAAIIRERFEVKTDVWPDQLSASTGWPNDTPAGRLNDVFPWQLDGAVMLVERRHDDYEREHAIEKAVEELGGTFAGT
jgi:hypothetical protein